MERGRREKGYLSFQSCSWVKKTPEVAAGAARPCAAVSQARALHQGSAPSSGGVGTGEIPAFGAKLKAGAFYRTAPPAATAGTHGDNSATWYVVVMRDGATSHKVQTEQEGQLPNPARH